MIKKLPHFKPSSTQVTTKSKLWRRISINKSLLPELLAMNNYSRVLPKTLKKQPKPPKFSKTTKP